MILIIFEITNIINELNKEAKATIALSKTAGNFKGGFILENKNQELEELKRKLQELEKDKKEGE